MFIVNRKVFTRTNIHQTCSVLKIHGSQTTPSVSRVRPAVRRLETLLPVVLVSACTGNSSVLSCMEMVCFSVQHLSFN